MRTTDTQPPALDVREVRTSTDPAVRLIVRGELDVASSMILGERLRNLREDGDGVLLDLRGLTLLDSSGVRALLAASAEAERDGRGLRVVPPSGGPLRVLQLCDAEGLLPLAPESS